jgi:hypothetical protein
VSRVLLEGFVGGLSRNAESDLEGVEPPGLVGALGAYGFAGLCGSPGLRSLDLLLASLDQALEKVLVARLALLIALRFADYLLSNQCSAPSNL